ARSATLEGSGGRRAGKGPRGARPLRVVVGGGQKKGHARSATLEGGGGWRAEKGPRAERDPWGRWWVAGGLCDLQLQPRHGSFTQVVLGQGEPCAVEHFHRSGVDLGAGGSSPCGVHRVGLQDASTFGSGVFDRPVQQAGAETAAASTVRQPETDECPYAGF